MPSAIESLPVPEHEAEGLFLLVKKRRMTVPQVRDLITVSMRDAAEIERVFGRVVALTAVTLRARIMEHFEKLVAKELQR